MRKLSDSELVARTRDANRRRSERARERLTIAGRAALTVWLPVGLRRDFVAEAAGSGMTINELATKLIEKGMRERSEFNSDVIPDPDAKLFSIPDPDTADLFATPEPEPTDTKENAPADLLSVSVGSGSDRDAMMALVARLLAEGLTGADIARNLTAAGYKSQQGTELRGANVLREYRQWKEKQSR
jgi:hypothetical protein